MTTVRTVIHDPRRIEIPAPTDLADGTKVILTIGTDVVDDDGPTSPRGDHPRPGRYGAIAATGGSRRCGGGP